MKTQNLLPSCDPEVMTIRNLLHNLGLTENRVGFYYIEEAVRLAAKDSSRLLRVTKRLYPETAGCFQTSWRTVERGIRYCIGKAWETDPDRLQKVLDIKTEKKPAPAVFLCLLCAQLQREVRLAESES